ncbi:bifunctional 4-hydroxy-3-methylbut-2-enyl diphosphate reductase/30S ribosomal protein S1 [Oscillospiraceae bacterium OttesenSCG-928-G22]|nr:bifunctional 4-hydroxy-3-methylbut-2-enyl diphosphate reductase/30S ribosomal protein S1 [Oscillospiraceae bacterium OttesenSCG-928-G22]
MAERKGGLCTDVRIAKSAGFCFGVDRAVTLAFAHANENTAALGPVIHNDAVMKRLFEKGLREIARPEEAKPGETVLLPSHGASKETYEILEKRGAVVVDATCPFVRRIHGIVADAAARGDTVFVLGDKAHTEVRGILGYAENACVFSDFQELEAYVNAASPPEGFAPVLVAQTTMALDIWRDASQFLKKEYTNAKIFDTICNATHVRQQETEKLATSCDVMFVVGDRRSANTGRLFDIAKRTCPRAHFVESADDITSDMLREIKAIGITAGASTPRWIIEEVNRRMSDEMRNNGTENLQEESFAELLEQSFKTLNTGEKVTGVVTGISGSEVHVDLGTKHAGYIPLSELSDDPSVRPEDVFNIGDEIETFVLRVNDVEGTVMLSQKRLESIRGWEEIETACENRETVEGIVHEENKGGVVASVKGVRVFIPSSQTGIPKGQPLGVLLKTKVKMKITEVNRARRRVVGSIRAVENEARKELADKIWNDIAEGKTYKGVVKSLTSYGAFIDIGGVDGMVHISELSWSRVRHPSEVVNPGDEVDVYVISFDPEKKKISLGFRNPADNPWLVFKRDFNVNDVVNAKVVKLMPFGAFAEIVPGVDGLIHISQISDTRIGKPGDVLSEGEMVDVKITSVDDEKQKVWLSIRALKEEASDAAAEADENRPVPEDGVVAVFEDGALEVKDEKLAEETETVVAKPEEAATEEPAAETDGE